MRDCRGRTSRAAAKCRGLRRASSGTSRSTDSESRPIERSSMRCSSRYIGQPSLDLGLHIDVRGTTLERVLFVFLDSERNARISKDPGSEGRYAEKLFAVVVVGYRKSPDRWPGSVLALPLRIRNAGVGSGQRDLGYPRQHAKLKIGEIDVTGRQSFSVRSLSTLSRSSVWVRWPRN